MRILRDDERGAPARTGSLTASFARACSMSMGAARRAAPSVGAFAASRVVLAIALFTAAVLRPGYRPSQLFFDWDGVHYLTIARDGYPPLYPAGGGYRAESAFFPLLPLLTRTVAEVGPLSIRQAAVVVTLTVSVLAMVLVGVLAAETFGDRVGPRAVLLVALWPGSLALSMFYSDGLMVLLAAACLLFLRRRQWVLAGIAAMLATASRPTAIALAPACLFAAVDAWRHKRALLPFIAPALAPLGMVAYFTYLHFRLGDFFLWFEAEDVGWGAHFDFGRYFVDQLLVRGFQNPVADVGLFVSGVAGLVGIGLLVWSLRERLPGEQLVYAGIVLTLALGTGLTAAPSAGIPRYVFNAFPIFFAPAKSLSETAFGGWAAVSAAGLVGFALMVGLTRTVLP
jgi:hypothetical protein